MNGIAIRTVLRLAVYGSAVVGSAWLLKFAQGHRFSWWWPLVVVAVSLAYAAVVGPCDAGRGLWRVSDTIRLTGVALLAAAAGRLTLTPGREAWAALCWLALLIVLAVTGGAQTTPADDRSPPTLNVQWRRLVTGAMLALALAGAAALLARSPEQTAVALVLWAGALAVMLRGCKHSAVYPVDHRERSFPPILLELAILVAIVAAAVAVRTIGLVDVPVITDGDEGRIGLHILDTFRGLSRPIFDFGWNGFGQIPFIIHGAWMKVCGPSLAALRMGSATAGAIGVALLYLFLRELCGWRVAVIGAALLAANPEHIAWSRSGLMNVQAITLITLAMAALAAALRRGRLVWWAVLGTALGGCLLTYHAAKAALGVAAVVLVVEVVIQRKRRRSLVAGAVVTAIALLVTVLPHLPPIVERWDEYSVQIGNRFDIHRLTEAVQDGDNERVRRHLRTHVGSVVVVPVTCRQGGFVPAGGFFDQGAAIFVVGAPLWLLFWWRQRSSRMILIWIAVFAVSSGMLTFDPPWKPRLVMALPALVAAVAMVIDLSGRCGESGRSRWTALLPWSLAGLCVLSGLAETWTRQVDPFWPGFVTSNPKSSLIRVLRGLDQEGWIGSDPVLLLGATNRDEANLYFAQRHGLLGAFDGIVDVGDDVSALPIVDPQGRRHLVIVAPHQDALLSVIRAHYPEAPEQRILGARGETMFTVIRLDEELVRGSWGLRRLDGDRGSNEPVRRPPFELEGGESGSWGGTLFVPFKGRLGLEIPDCETAGVRIDGWQDSGDARTVWVEAAVGWHDIRIHALAPAAGCSVTPRWLIGAGASWDPIPQWAFRPERSPHGLLLRLWRGRDRPADVSLGQVPDLWRIDPVLSYDFDMVERQETLPGVMHEAVWVARWDGTVRVPQASRWSFEVEFDTPWAELEVGELRARSDKPGVARVEGALEAGDHRLSIRTGVDGQRQLRRLVVKLRWAAAGDPPAPVPYGALTPPADLMISPVGDQVRPSSSCRPPCGSTGKKSVEFVEAGREVGILKCSIFSSGRLSAVGVGIHLQHIRQSLGPLSPTLQSDGRQQLPRPCQPFASP